MTLAAALTCRGGVIFGADTEETAGYIRGQVWKLEALQEPTVSAVITGSCDDSELMDAAMEAIMDELRDRTPPDDAGVHEALKKVMYDLYANAFAVYPQKSKKISLLVGVKLGSSSSIGTWHIESSVRRRIKRHLEVVGTGWLVEPFMKQLLAPTMSLDDGELALLQLLYVAKMRVSGVGGDSCIVILHDDGRVSQNRQFPHEKERLWEEFLMYGRDLLLATGNGKKTEQEYQKLLDAFGEQMKYLRERLLKP